MTASEADVNANRRQFDRMLSIELLALAQLVRGRNVAYAGGDPFKCWRKRGLLGLLVRLEDKLNRFETFLEGGGVTEDAWREVLQDIAGYALCGLVWVASGEAPVVLDTADEQAP